MKTTAIILAVLSVFAFIAAIFSSQPSSVFTSISTGVLLAITAAYIDLRCLIRRQNQMLLDLESTKTMPSRVRDKHSSKT